jgi:hypothetical protein
LNLTCLDPALQPSRPDFLKDPSGPQHSDIVPRIQRQQILIAGHDGNRVRGKRKFEVLVVLGVAAVLDDLCQLSPESRRCQQIKDLAAPIDHQHAGKFRPLQDRSDLSKTTFDRAITPFARCHQGTTGVPCECKAAETTLLASKTLASKT